LLRAKYAHFRTDSGTYVILNIYIWVVGARLLTIATCGRKWKQKAQTAQYDDDAIGCCVYNNNYRPTGLLPDEGRKFT